MTKTEIQALVNSGKNVYCYNKNYQVVKNNDKFFIKCLTNDFLEPLTDNRGRLIEDEKDFLIL